jgi:hypothetical protein
MIERRALLMVTLLSAATLTQAQEINNQTQIDLLPEGTTTSWIPQSEADAAQDVFGKEPGQVTALDVEAILREQRATLYTAPGFTVLNRDKEEPVLLTPNGQDMLNASYLCRIIPVCTEIDQR